MEGCFWKRKASPKKSGGGTGKNLTGGGRRRNTSVHDKKARENGGKGWKMQGSINWEGKDTERKLTRVQKVIRKKLFHCMDKYEEERKLR